MRNLMIASCFLFSMACAVQADEFAIKLKEGAGKDLTQVQCSACHSLDYIQMNSPFLGQAAWQAEVTKMISVFGADIKEAEAKQIVEYLTC